MKEQFYLFWGGKASQWYPSAMEAFGLKFNCAEQFMMASKAAFFKDKEIFDKIMAEESPGVQKVLGRKVRGFTASEWNLVKEPLVFIGNLVKFSQNDDLWEWLFEKYKNYERFVEASPYDTIWGIGLGSNDPRALNESEWLGENLLGEAIDEAYHFLNDNARNRNLKPFYEMVDNLSEIFNQMK